MKLIVVGQLVFPNKIINSKLFNPGTFGKPNLKRKLVHEMEINNGQPLACDITRDSSFKCNNMLNKK